MRTTRTLVLFLLATFAAGATLSAKQGHARGRYDSPAYFAMSGTYQLEATRGDDPRRAADRATRDLPRWQRDRAYQSLLLRLEPPRMLSIDRDRNGRTFTIASSSGPRTSFEVDRRDWRERGYRGRDVNFHVEYVSDRLSIWSVGDRDTDFNVTFQAMDRGDVLLVTRRFDSEALRSPVTIRSYYRRMNRDPRWDIYVPVRVVDRRPAGGYGIPEGTRLVATLDTALNTRTSRDGTAFTMTVRGPGEFQGARIDGVVDRVEQYSRDRNADMRLVFDKIHLRNGRDMDFDAIIESVRTPSGASMRVDTSSNEVDDRSKTADTIEKGAVGAGLGAVVGAIIGGGKGAAIGAAIGGAGGVIVAQNRNEVVDLPPGTQVTMVVAATTR